MFHKIYIKIKNIEKRQLMEKMMWNVPVELSTLVVTGVD